MNRWPAFAEARRLGVQSPYLEENEHLAREIATALAAKQIVPASTWSTLSASYRAQKRWSACLALGKHFNATNTELVSAWQQRINAWLGNDAPKIDNGGDGGLRVNLAW